MFGERRCRRHSKKGEEAIQIVRSGGNQIAIPFHDIGCFAQFIEHWTAIEDVDRMQLERKRGYDAEVSAAATNGPEQIGILIGICLYEYAVRQYNVGGEQIVDAQSAFAGQMADSSAQG